MRRRICVAVVALSAASLMVGAGAAAAASGTPFVLKCKMAITAQPPAGSATVDQPPAGGSQYGPMRCGRAGFGGGVFATSFTVPDSGDSVGHYTQYFHAGSISGKFDLVPQEGGPVSSNFEAQTWVGKLTVTGGTGIYTGIKGKKGTGVLKCNSPDTVHLFCTEKVKITAG